ncbi:maleylpyruvate isomerase family mycothiol-dependent enzyme [Gordonia sp. (in: high G+C Gram-positive bacteria)]|uniref:maleylpyruvate isomerase family mycothiol-dependent enzyme n=1 Tax=Gordonia sp. (in: high G+C Gram-positive bacteria) TaxID=84139 RepID=UPI003340F354
MKTIVEKTALIDALEAQWQSIDDLVTPLTDEQWTTATGLPGWTVADVVAHVIGTESMLDGRTVESIRDVESLDHVKNPIGVLNENWLDHYRARTRDDVMTDYRALTAKRVADLHALDDDAWNADAVTPVGPESYGRFMRVRNFDCWVHEIDIRDALGIGDPALSEPARFALAEFAHNLPYVVGKKARVPAGSAVTFEFVGLVPSLTHVAVGERAAVVPELDRAADVTLRMSVADYARLAGGRPGAATATVVIEGDKAIGDSIADNLHYLI